MSDTAELQGKLEFIRDVECTTSAEKQAINEAIAVIGEEKRTRMTDIFIRDRHSGRVHRIGDEPHDSLYVDADGTVHYYNLQCGDGATGYKSLERRTLGDEWDGFKGTPRENELTAGFEFVPCEFGELTEFSESKGR